MSDKIKDKSFNQDIKRAKRVILLTQESLLAMDEFKKEYPEECDLIFSMGDVSEDDWRKANETLIKACEFVLQKYDK